MQKLSSHRFFFNYEFFFFFITAKCK